MSAFVLDTEMAPGGSFVPLDGPSTRTGPPPTMVEACAPFKLVYNPRRYTVLGGKVIPEFGKMPLVGGIGGCDDVKDRVTGAILRVNSTTARSNQLELGRTIIEPDQIPDSHVRPGYAKSYLWRPQGRPDVNLLIYTKCFPGSAAIEVDVPRYIEWIEWLITEKIIPPCPLHILRKMLGERMRERDRLSDVAITSPSRRPEVEKMSLEIKAIEAEIANRSATPTPSAGESADLDADVGAASEVPAKRTR